MFDGVADEKTHSAHGLGHILVFDELAGRFGVGGTPFRRRSVEIFLEEGVDIGLDLGVYIDRQVPDVFFPDLVDMPGQILLVSFATLHEVAAVVMREGTRLDGLLPLLWAGGVEGIPVIVRAARVVARLAVSERLLAIEIDALGGLVLEVDVIESGKVDGHFANIVAQLFPI